MDKITHKVRCEQWTNIIKECLTDCYAKTGVYIGCRIPGMAEKIQQTGKKGEKGIQIIVPAPVKEKHEIEKVDPETGEIILGEDGQPETEVVEQIVPRFRVTTVFDVSQTIGEPIPGFEVPELEGNVLIYDHFMDALQAVAPVPFQLKEIEGAAKGYYNFTDKYIGIQFGMSEAQTMKTAHAVLHDWDQMKVDGIVKD